MESVGAILQFSPPARDFKPSEGKTESAEVNTKSEYPTAKCKHCGRTLYFGSICLKDKIFWHKEPERCNCTGAIKYWQNYDTEQERKNRAAEEAEARRRKQERIDRLIGNSGIKKRFQNRIFANFQITDINRDAYKIAKNYADNFSKYASAGKGLFFEGTNGTGKTHLAAAIALKLIGEGIPCIIKTSIDMLGDIKSTFDSNGDANEQQVLKIYKDVDLLVIDDLGKEQCTDWAMTTLYAIINDRYENMRPTVITTNDNDEALISRLKLKGIDEKIMTAIVSRLKECSILVLMYWADWRIKK